MPDWWDAPPQRATDVHAPAPPPDPFADRLRPRDRAALAWSEATARPAWDYLGTFSTPPDLALLLPVLRAALAAGAKISELGNGYVLLAPTATAHPLVAYEGHLTQAMEPAT